MARELQSLRGAVEVAGIGLRVEKPLHEGEGGAGAVGRGVGPQDLHAELRALFGGDLQQCAAARSGGRAEQDQPTRSVQGSIGLRRQQLQCGLAFQEPGGAGTRDRRCGRNKWVTPWPDRSRCHADLVVGLVVSHGGGRPLGEGRM